MPENVYTAPASPSRVLSGSQGFKRAADCAAVRSQRRIDPRVSLVALVCINVQLGITTALWVEGVAAVVALACMLYCRRYRSAAGWLAVYAAFACIGFGSAALDNTFIAPFAAMFLVYRHVLPAFMFASNMIATTKLGELACALQSLRLSSKMIVAICVALRFFPTIGREFKAVREAMKTRGISLSLTTIVLHPLQTIERFMVPVMGRLGTVADELGNAVVVRGVETTRRRTSYYQLSLSAVDAAVLIASCALPLLALLVRTGVIV